MAMAVAVLPAVRGCVPTSEAFGDAESEDLPVFENFDNLTLSSKIGRGAFGEVYKANLAGEVVAVKVLTADPARDRASNMAYKQFLREAAVLQRCKHP